MYLLILKKKKLIKRDTNVIDYEKVVQTWEQGHKNDLF